MFRICIPAGHEAPKCWYIPVIIERWRDLLTPPTSFIGRIVWRLRVAALHAIGPRPHPWRPIELVSAGLDDSVLDDLRRLSTIQALSAGLRPSLRDAIRRGLNEATATLNVQHIVDVDTAGDVTRG
jgi:hypothetical protein